MSYLFVLYMKMVLIVSSCHTVRQPATVTVGILQRLGWRAEEKGGARETAQPAEGNVEYVESFFSSLTVTGSSGRVKDIRLSTSMIYKHHQRPHDSEVFVFSNLNLLLFGVYLFWSLTKDPLLGERSKSNGCNIVINSKWPTTSRKVVCTCLHSCLYSFYLASP